MVARIHTGPLCGRQPTSSARTGAAGRRDYDITEIDITESDVAEFDITENDITESDITETNIT